MGDVEDAHIGTAAGTSLLDHIRSSVEGVDEAHRAGGDSTGGTNHVSFGAKPVEREAGTAAALVEQRRFFYPRKYGVQRIVHGKHKAGRELLQLPPGVHQSRRVGQEFQGCHDVEELIFGGLPFHFRGPIVQVGLGQVFRHTSEHTFRIFQHITFPIFGQVASFQYHSGVVGQL